MQRIERGSSPPSTVSAQQDTPVMLRPSHPLNRGLCVQHGGLRYVHFRMRWALCPFVNLAVSDNLIMPSICHRISVIPASQQPARLPHPHTQVWGTSTPSLDVSEIPGADSAQRPQTADCSSTIPSEGTVACRRHGLATGRGDCGILGGQQRLPQLKVCWQLSHYSVYRRHVGRLRTTDF